MPISAIGEVGAGAISGGAVVAFAMKLVSILMRRINGRKIDNRNSTKPGKAKACIERGKEIAQHDIIIKHLCELSEKADTRAETARKENREDHQRIFDKLDEMRK